MVESLLTRPDSRRYRPLVNLILTRTREFYREPEAIFWVYGFPLLMVVALGIAFRNQPIERLRIDLSTAGESDRVLKLFGGRQEFIVAAHDQAACLRRLRTGKTDLVVVAHAESEISYEYHFDPTQPSGLVARDAVNDLLQRAAGRRDPAPVENVRHSEPGGRYIDFLVPGLLGMGLMGGGMFGVGFVAVDMRIRNLLKRFLATPMKKSHFLAALMVSRLLGMLPEVLLLLLFAWLIFGVVSHGSLLAVVSLILLGAVMFAGIGLLVASRPRTIEAVSGLMNLVMMPMWILSGIFFSSDRFPDVAQPLIKILPLTPLISSLRAVMLDGVSISTLTLELSIMAVWTVVSFTLALKLFRWT